MNKVLIAGAVLAVAVTVTIISPDSDLRLSHHFGRRVETGHNYKESETLLLAGVNIKEECNLPDSWTIYHNREVNHIAVLNEDFDDTIQISFTPELDEPPDEPPIVIIQNLDKKMNYCEVSNTVLSGSVIGAEFNSLPAGTYLIWVGGRKKDKSYDYTMEVTEH